MPRKPTTTAPKTGIEQSRGRQNRKDGQARLLRVDPRSLHPSPENDALYQPVMPTDKAVVELAGSIRERGVFEPLVVTADGYVVSGHRRRMAAIVAGVEDVPVRYLAECRCDFKPDQYVSLLREHNRQRVKSIAETIREAVVDTDPEQAYKELLTHRVQVEPDVLTAVNMTGEICRKKISEAKAPMIRAVLMVLRQHKRWLPINDRKIHYELAQHHKPLRHASKPGSHYGADTKSYKDLTDLITRMRAEGIIPHYVISDETRPESVWKVWSNVGDFISDEVKGFAKGYWRDLMQSQEVHVEIAVEKNTAVKVIEEIAKRYTIPVTSLRGMTSMPTKYRIAERFKATGKSRLVLLLATDFDPTGEAIAENLAKGLRDEFGVVDLAAYKIAVTPDQARELGTVQSVEGIGLKAGDQKAKRFREHHGADVVAYELEALSVQALQRLTAEAIDAVINVDLINAEREQERLDSVEISNARKRPLLAMGEQA
jgi:hypothetical protein